MINNNHMNDEGAVLGKVVLTTVQIGLGLPRAIFLLPDIFPNCTLIRVIAYANCMTISDYYNTKPVCGDRVIILKLLGFNIGSTIKLLTFNIIGNDHLGLVK